ncbi:restriction endonuclease [uncultured Methanobrevibacter sp.]|uniref:restriction endonuclease n=1 Tax=uncultured Methanobrevibacter sp. TaxID=253161 RepID=UPI002615F43B|nr:restriction endonuclease [uncultured Methanobrevibacter sp.]
MEKPQLINFIAKVMEDSGFKIYKNFKTSQRVIDIYAILPTTMGDFGVVVACKNYDRDFEVGVDVLKEMEEAGESLKASKVAVISSSKFTNQATNYALRKNIKLVDRDKLIELAKKYQNKTENQSTLDTQKENEDVIEDYYDYSYDSDDMDYLMRRQDEEDFIYNSNSLYPYDDHSHSHGLLSKLGGHSESRQRASLAPVNSYYYDSSPSFNFDFVGILTKILANPIAAVILVVLVSYGLSYLFGNVLKAGGGAGGLVEMLAALAMSYGLTYFFSERSKFFIIRGTVIFFVSLIILIILIFI